MRQGRGICVISAGVKWGSRGCAGTHTTSLKSSSAQKSFHTPFVYMSGPNQPLYLHYNMNPRILMHFEKQLLSPGPTGPLLPPAFLLPALKSRPASSINAASPSRTSEALAYSLVITLVDIIALSTRQINGSRDPKSCTVKGASINT